MTIIVDNDTYAEYLAAATPSEAAQAVLDALANAGTVSVACYDGNGALKAGGTMGTPWATRSAAILTVGEVAGFQVSSGGTPDAASWYLRFEAGTRWVRGSLGPPGSGADFVASLATWVAGMGGELGAVSFAVQTNSAPSLVGAPSTLSFVQGVGGSYNFGQHGSDPDGDSPLTYSLIGQPYTGISISPTGWLSATSEASAGVRALTIRIADPAGLSSDWNVSVTLQALAPAFTVAPVSATVSPGQSIAFAASDQNPGEVLAYSLRVTRAGITIDESSGLVAIGEEAAETSGPIIVRATDPTGLWAEAQCAVSVLATSAGAGFQFPPGATIASTAPLTAEPTFHNIGLYWREPTGSASDEALVRYRPVGGVWKQALSLAWDRRTVGINPNMPADRTQEYRGSILKVDPNTQYEVEVLTTVGRRLASVSVATWSETFPEGVTTQVGTRTTPYVISAGGTSDAYRVYEASPGATITVTEASNYALRVNAPYVIVRGFTLIGGKWQGINLGELAHHVVIEDNDVSGFGHVAADTYPDYHAEFCANGVAAIGVSSWEYGWWSAPYKGYQQSHYVIQNNRLHDCAYDTNSWAERHQTDTFVSSGNYHPRGGHGIYLIESGGHHVIRYNSIYNSSGLAVMFNDGIGGGANFSYHGNVYKDSDVYGNQVSHCWDECIECEGANINVRIYDNECSYSFQAVANADVTVGPVYVIRNVAHHGRRSDPGELEGYGYFWKYRSDSVPLGYGSRAYVLHNTAYRVSSTDRLRQAINGTVETVFENVVMQNNIWDCVYESSSNARLADCTTNLLPAGQDWTSDTVPRTGTPVYDAAGGSGPYALSSTSPGLNAGTPIPNVSDDYSGSAPDVGAQERGAAAAVYGVRP